MHTHNAHKPLRYLLVGFLLAMLANLLTGALSAQETSEALASTSEAIVETESAALSQTTGDILWLIVAGLLVFLMQAGFAMVETGFTRTKNSCNIMMKNIMDCCVGGLTFFAIGYCFMYGESSGFIGFSTEYIFMSGYASMQDPSETAGWFFQVVFAATAATIVAGAMAERTKFIGYILCSMAITGLIYPIAGGWIWNADGWLSAMGIRDFAGSTVVHSIGAWAGLAGTLLLGPRTGKYDAEGNPKPIPGHNLPIATLGMFLLWFGWFGFNPGSTLAAVDGIAHIAVTTFLAACAGGAATVFTTWFKFGKPDLSMTLNGVLAGLVSITAPCASVDFMSAVVIGGIGGVFVVFSVLMLEKLRVDDPVGAISVHGVCGAWGTLSIGLFGSATIDSAIWGSEGAIQNGLFMGGGFAQMIPQLAGVISIFLFTFIASYAIFFVIHNTVGLRVSEEEEMEGLDLGEHGNEAYADFQLYADELSE